MTFGPDEILACPRCGSPQCAFTLTTANSFGASYWTDGLVHFPMRWRRPLVSRCTSCGRFYWVLEAPHLGYVDRWGRPAQEAETPDPPEWASAGEVDALSLDACLEALEAGIADTEEREYALRTLAWWRSSDRNRNWRKKKVRQKTPADRGNMDALRQALERRFEAGGHPSHALLLVELERQLGRLPEAMGWLEHAAAGVEALPKPVEVDDPDDLEIEAELDRPLGAGWIGAWTHPPELGCLLEAQRRLVAAAQVSVDAVSFRGATAP